MKKSTLLILSFLCLSFTIYLYSYPVEDVYEMTGKDYFQVVKKLLSEAKKSIYISMYMATYYPDRHGSLPNQLLQELVSANERGVEVRVILDQETVSAFKRQYNDPAYFFLKDKGIQVDYDTPATKLHDKLIIIDEGITIIGSHNWSERALKENSEVSVVIKSPELASKLKKWISSIQISPRRTPPPESKTLCIYIPYQFLTNPKMGVRMYERTMRFYLYLLKKWEEVEHTVIILDYLEAARFIDLGHFSKRVYRLWINNHILRVLQDDYKLISFKTQRKGPAEIKLLDYKDLKKPFKPDPRDCFIIPGSFWEFDWVRRLSRNAKYFYFINLVETSLTLDPHGWWSHSQKYLDKKYNLDHSCQSRGIIELSRYNLLTVEYADLIYPFKDYVTATRYRLLPLYSWEWHQQELEKLKDLYGSNKVEKTRQWASVVLEENNLEVIEKLINYFNQHGGALVQYAVDRVARKRIGNPKRSYVYIEGIILSEVGEREEPVD